MKKSILIILAILGSYQVFAETDHMLKQYAAYNLWANERMAGWLKDAPEEVWTTAIESSFNSLKSTVLHIWSAEFLWLRVLQDSSYQENPTRNFVGSANELLNQWLEASQAFYSYVDTLNEDELAAAKESSSGQAPLLIADIIQHCMNHSTFHRGQLVTMGRQAGLPAPPRTDFIFFVRE